MWNACHTANSQKTPHNLPKGLVQGCLLSPFLSFIMAVEKTTISHKNIFKNVTCNMASICSLLNVLHCCLWLPDVLDWQLLSKCCHWKPRTMTIYHAKGPLPRLSQQLCVFLVRLTLVRVILHAVWCLLIHWCHNEASSSWFNWYKINRSITINTKLYSSISRLQNYIMVFNDFFVNGGTGSTGWLK